MSPLTEQERPAAERPAYREYLVEVSRVRRLSPHFTRVTLRGPDLAHLGTAGLDQRIKLVLPLADTGFSTFPDADDWYAAWRQLPEEQRNPVRTYTIRSPRPESRELDVDFVGHGDGGPASAWAGRAREGDRLIVIGPDGRSPGHRSGIAWNPGSARRLLIAGDETAAPAIGAILGSLPADAVGRVFIEVPSAADELELEAPPGVVVTWLPRSDPGSGYGGLLVPAVRDWALAARERWVADRAAGERARPTDDDGTGGADDDLLWEVPGEEANDGIAEPAPPGDLYAWLAGEAGAIKTLRRFLVSEMGIDRRAVAFMGYWRLGSPEA